MRIRIFLTTIVLFFLFQPMPAQDTLKHVSKLTHKAHASDSAQVAHSGHKEHVKDTAKSHKEHPVVMPKYPRDGYVAIMGGLGLPLAAFASNTGAGTGSNFSISAAFPGVVSHWGIAFKFDYGTNSLNKGRVDNIANNNAGFANINCTASDTLGHCSYSAFLSGLYLTYPHKHYTIDFRFLAGAMIATIPALTITYNDETAGNSASYTQATTSGSAFAIDFGFELRVPVKPSLSVFLSGDYLHAVPAFSIITTGATLTSYGSIVPDNGNGQEVTTDHPFNVFSLSLGVGYTLSAKGKVESRK